MRSSVDAALGRVALVLRLIGAVWMVVLALVYGATGQLTRPRVVAAVAVGGVAWALVLARGRWLDRGGPRAPGEAEGRGRAVVLGVDLAVASAVVVVPAVAGEAAGFAGGYPFAALVVGLAVGGRRGVWTAVAVLSAATIASLVLVGSAISPFVAGQLLLYVFSAVAMVLGVEVFRTSETRAARAEADLAVAEERSATAAHLHDSVLQTLALVQRRAEDPAAVRSLARRQERELRGWLFPGPAGAGAVAGGATGLVTLGDALAALAESVQADHDVAVRVVTVGGVGDLAVGEGDRTGLAAVVAAAGEAMANAAVHAGVADVDVYAEPSAAGSGVTVFVRDRGSGFDLAAVPADRQGVRGSILGRVRRAGGTAEVVTAPGRGTEVRLSVAVGGHDGRSGSGSDDGEGGGS